MKRQKWLNFLFVSVMVSNLGSCTKVKIVGAKKKSPILISQQVESESASIQDVEFEQNIHASSVLGKKERTLAGRKKNRAYRGAPPRIPHEVEESSKFGLGKPCISCHELGGFAKKMGLQIPVTPHPKWLNCRQCHVAVISKSTFTDNSFIGLVAPVLQKRGTTSYLPGGPPRIPHSLQMRGNCLACHSGAGAIERIRTSHPERTNCRQCHVPVLSRPWRRG